ncbi:hypothetical protein [Rubrivivax gelatinosus]|uniref:hypothetical protein n=1 Tax=Rubrivivax gelatinosus TaxID=28068 RepID=UPI0005C19749|nr:hypothetical protein [Rubrivivax gelatinosus]MBG6083109.1 hypothetical protein [Rubrivivax gelatinosus]
MKDEYLITAEVPAKGSIDELTAALQEAFDNGVDGFFRVIVTHQPTYIVVFLRSTRDGDAVYIRNRLEELDGDVEHAAQAQLAAELREAGGHAVADVIEVLRDGDGQVIDFANALLEIVAPTSCRRCGSTLDEDGHCADTTCPFSKTVQSDPAGWAGHPEEDSSSKG